jgi:hypothetical protein
MLVVVIVAILAIAAVCVWVFFMPSDHAIARAHRRTLDRQNRRDECNQNVSNSEASAERNVATIQVSSIIALCLLLLVYGMHFWLFARPYVYKPWSGSEVGPPFMWLTWIVTIAVTPCAFLLAVQGAIRHRTVFAKTICALSVIPIVYVLTMCIEITRSG